MKNCVGLFYFVLCDFFFIVYACVYCANYFKYLKDGHYTDLYFRILKKRLF